MTRFFTIILYALLLICGGCAITEVVLGGGTVFGLALVIAGMGMIVYIMRLPIDGVK